MKRLMFGLMIVVAIVIFALPRNPKVLPSLSELILESTQIGFSDEPELSDPFDEEPEAPANATNTVADGFVLRRDTAGRLASGEISEINHSVRVVRLDAWAQRELADCTGRTVCLTDQLDGPLDGTAKVAVVYLHGFSASPMELDPFPSHLARALDGVLIAPVFRGHGADGHALAAARVTDWQRDALQALQLAEVMAPHTILLGNSTGASLALWLALYEQPVWRVPDAMILLAPNFSPKDPMAQLLWAPGMPWWISMLGEHAFAPQNEQHAAGWTTRYPRRALLQMMTVAEAAWRSPMERLDRPTLVLYHPEDRVVDVERIARGCERMPAHIVRCEAMSIAGDQSRHLLAGDILAPDGNGIVLRMIEEFLLDVSSISVSTMDLESDGS
ncbi:MAG: alpha/beta hydrolase [Thioalkalivibrionaceae bacterium]